MAELTPEEQKLLQVYKDAEFWLQRAREAKNQSAIALAEPKFKAAEAAVAPVMVKIWQSRVALAR